MNKTTSFHVIKLRTFWEKAVGLMGKSKIVPVSLDTHWGIHTFGVRSPIDVVILDNNNRVAKLTQNLPPNRIFLWNPLYQHVIELPAGAIAKKKITLGSTVKIPEDY